MKEWKGSSKSLNAWYNGKEAIDNMKKNCVIGLGKLGLTWALVLREAGIEVYGYDKNIDTREYIKTGREATSEPGNKELLEKHLGKNFQVIDSLSTTSGITERYFIVVPTPSGDDDTFSTVFVEEVFNELDSILLETDNTVDIVLVSTVMPGALRSCIVSQFSDKNKRKIISAKLNFLYNPEFIALGTVMKDMLEPDFVLIGSDDEAAASRLASVYQIVNGAGINICKMSIESAEITKIAINTFLTLKISYANLIGMIAQRTENADPEDIYKAVGSDSRIGTKYLRPGIGFGGPCLPRDTRAFSQLCRSLGLPPDIPQASSTINETIKKNHVNFVDEIIEEVISSNINNPSIGYVGLTYKKGSWLTEDSQQLEMLRMLKDKWSTSLWKVYDEFILEIFERTALRITDPDIYNIATDNTEEFFAGGFDIVIVANAQNDGFMKKLLEYGSYNEGCKIINICSFATNNDAMKGDNIKTYAGALISKNQNAHITIEHNLFARIKKWYTLKCDCELEVLHKNRKNDEYANLASKYTDQSSHFHDRIHKGYDEDAHFIELYEELIAEVIEKIHLRDSVVDQYIVQAFPTVRIQFPDNISVFEFHKDSFYNHPSEEINHFLALTNCVGTAALWRESTYIDPTICEPRFEPTNLDAGQLIKFDTSNVWHGDLPNLTHNTRVSIDFRLLRSDESLTGKATLSGKKSIRLGSYYKKYDTVNSRFI